METWLSPIVFFLLVILDVVLVFGIGGFRPYSKFVGVDGEVFFISSKMVPSNNKLALL